MAGSMMPTPMPVWNRRHWCLTPILWKPFYLLVGVFVSNHPTPASAGALAEGSPLQPCLENCPWAREITLPRVKMASFEVRNPGEGYKSLPWQTLQHDLCSGAWKDMVEATFLPFPSLLSLLHDRCFLRELPPYIPCMQSSIVNSVSRELDTQTLNRSCFPPGR